MSAESGTTPIAGDFGPVKKPTFTLGELFTREWKCEARVFDLWRCTEDNRRTETSHEECGWVFVPNFDPDEWEHFKGLMADNETDWQKFFQDRGYGANLQEGSE